MTRGPYKQGRVLPCRRLPVVAVGQDFAVQGVSHGVNQLAKRGRPHSLRLSALWHSPGADTFPAPGARGRWFVEFPLGDVDLSSAPGALPAAVNAWVAAPGPHPAGPPRYAPAARARRDVVICCMFGGRRSLILPVQRSSFTTDCSDACISPV